MNDERVIAWLREHKIGSTRTIRSLREEFGLSRWYEWKDVIYLPTLPLFEEHRERMWIENWPAGEALPPTEFRTELGFLPSGRENHELAVRRMTEMLGKGMSFEYGQRHRWDFGSYEITLNTLRRQKGGPRPLMDAQRELYDKTNISIRGTWERSWPEHDMRATLDHARILRIELGANMKRKRGSLHFEFKLTSQPPRASANSLLLWDDTATGFIGFMGDGPCWRIPKSVKIELTLDRTRRERSEASSKLGFGCKDAAGSHVLCDMLSASDEDGLDAAAAQVADFWQVPLQVRQHRGDY
ncbi:MAG: hypothetical protein IPK60_11595 [Sandaracinaceae bacterium]|nr:hypothetical protein [Sandaracinaceae bacterium]